MVQLRLEPALEEALLFFVRRGRPVLLGRGYGAPQRCLVFPATTRSSGVRRGPSIADRKKEEQTLGAPRRDAQAPSTPPLVRGSLWNEMAKLLRPRPVGKAGAPPVQRSRAASACARQKRVAGRASKAGSFSTSNASSVSPAARSASPSFALAALRSSSARSLPRSARNRITATCGTPSSKGWTAVLNSGSSARAKSATMKNPREDRNPGPLFHCAIRDVGRWTLGVGRSLHLLSNGFR